MNNQLSREITITKGLCIILMVIGHCGCPSLLYKFIYIFHMPVFFFFSGFFFSTSKLSSPKDYLRKKVKALWWPFVKWSVFFLIIHNLLFYIYFEQEFFSCKEIIKQASLIPFMYGNDPLIGGFWFLNNLFYSIVIVVALSLFLYRMRMSEKQIAITITSLSVFGLIIAQFICNDLDVNIISHAVGLLCSLACYALGYMFSVTGVFEKVMKPKVSFVLLSAVLLFLSAKYLSVLRPFTGFSPVLMPYVLFMALIGIYFIYSVAHFMGGGILSLKIEYIGNNTLHILTWHFLSFKILDMILVATHGLPISSMVSMYHLPSDMFFEHGWVLYAFIGVSLPLVMLALYNKLFSVIKKSIR